MNIHEFNNPSKRDLGVCNTFNLGDITDSRRVHKNLVVRSPIMWPRLSFKNPPKPCRNYLELLNCGIIFGRLFLKHSNPVETLVKALGIDNFDISKLGFSFEESSMQG